MIEGGNRLPDGVQEIALPIAGGDAGDPAKVAHEARKTADFSKVPAELNAEIHRLLVDAGSKQSSSIDGYLTNGLGLSQSDLQGLREALLQ